MKKPLAKWSEWRLCGATENLYDLTPEELFTFKLICREYYAIRTT
jgi:hypothetical protein